MAVNDSCPICLEVIDDENERATSACEHCFHRKCLYLSMRTGGLYICPVCRSPLGEFPSVLVVQDKRLQKYSKMLKVKLPFAVVRQRMEADGIPPTEIDAFFSCGISNSLCDEETLSATASTASTRFDPSPFIKMLKIGINEGAVRQKLLTAGLSEEDIDIFFSSCIDQNSV